MKGSSSSLSSPPLSQLMGVLAAAAFRQPIYKTTSRSNVELGFTVRIYVLLDVRTYLRAPSPGRKYYQIIRQLL